MLFFHAAGFAFTHSHVHSHTGGSEVWKAQLAAGSFRQASLSGSVPVSLKHLKKRRAGELSLTSSAEKISSSPQPEDRALITSAQGSDLTRFSFLL